MACLMFLAAAFQLSALAFRLFASAFKNPSLCFPVVIFFNDSLILGKANFAPKSAKIENDERSVIKNLCLLND